jgi:YbbR domain-containing protein
VVADLTNKELGERLIFLTADDSSLPDNTKVIGIEPASVKIRLERTIRKVVGIEPQFAGDLPDDVEIYSYSLAPKNVEIEGPQSLVEKTTALYTESINLEGRRNGFNASVAVEPPNSSLRIITPGTINISFEIGERRAFRKIPNVPVLWPDQPIGSRILTKTLEIEIFGPESVIQSIRPEDLTAEIRASDLPDGADSAVPRVKLSSEIERLVTVKNIYPKGVKVKRQ